MSTKTLPYGGDVVKATSETSQLCIMALYVMCRSDMLHVCKRQSPELWSVVSPVLLVVHCKHPILHYIDKGHK